ncbi:radical SAM protein [Fusibacter paucivorans]|uniref:Radical SAM protein n=1 Tax=Fusibacter paucivorans TaxID=76009 RepID=A0ABS5PQF0_9FIRM|nr:radical SAM protein [Fusibacter paucivorans]MBS7526262.1 radical SAM protein [Fusibacter paucivorans]
MRYEGAVYRPPSEARSLIIQTTIGCSHNQCTFCYMYKEKKFRVRKMEAILADLQDVKAQYGDITNNFFLADGNALCLGTDKLITILKTIKTLFPSSGRIGIYAAPKDILNKTPEDLSLLKANGIEIAYLGIESGSDKVLKDVNKGVTQQEMVEAGQKLKASGIKLSTMVISGLGGSADWELHAEESAKVVNAIQPDYLALLTLLTPEGTPLYDSIQNGTFKLLDPTDVLVETRRMLEKIELNDCVFRSNHVSNYLSLAGHFPEDKPKLLDAIDHSLGDQRHLRDEWMRQL